MIQMYMYVQMDRDRDGDSDSDSDSDSFSICRIKILYIMKRIEQNEEDNGILYFSLLIFRECIKKGKKRVPYNNKFK